MVGIALSAARETPRKRGGAGSRPKDDNTALAACGLRIPAGFGQGRPQSWKGMNPGWVEPAVTGQRMKNTISGPLQNARHPLELCDLLSTDSMHHLPQLLDSGSKPAEIVRSHAIMLGVARLHIGIA